MSEFSNITFTLPELNKMTRVTVNSGEAYTPYALVGPASKSTLTNKTIIDSSNNISANNLTVNGVSSKIIGSVTPTNGQVLTAVTGGYQFTTVSGVGTGTNVRYVSKSGSVSGDGSINSPFLTVVAAINSFSLTPTISKTIVIGPGNYSENVIITPNTTLIGVGRRTIITGTIDYDGVTDPTGYYSFRNIYLSQMLVNSSAFPSATVSYEYINVMADTINNWAVAGSEGITFNAWGCNIGQLSVLAETATIVGTIITGAVQLNIGILVSIQNCSVYNTITATSSSVSRAEMRLVSSMIEALIVQQFITVYTDGVSIPNNATYGADVLVSTINDHGILQVNRNNLLFGSMTANTIDDNTNCTVLGMGSVLASGSINRTTVGYGATTDADNQISFSDTATNLRAAGLTGHSAATNITYDTVTKRINYATSSRAYKTNIENLPIDESMHLVRGIRPVKYNWKSDGTLSHGIIAEELNELVDTIDGAECLVAKDENGKVLTVNYTLMIPHLINCIKNLEKRIIDLENNNE